MRTATAFLLSAALALSQDSWDKVRALRPGQVIEVRYGKSTVKGTLVESTADSLVVDSIDKKAVTTARPDVRRVYIPSNKRGRNAAIGAAVGAGIALLPALFIRRYLNNEAGSGDTGAAVMIGIGAGVGAGLGALDRGRELVYKK